MKRGVGKGREKGALEAGKEERDQFFYCCCFLFWFPFLTLFFLLVYLCGMVYVCIWYGMCVCVYIWYDICMVGCMHVLVSVCAWANEDQKCTPDVFPDCSPPFAP